MFATKTIFFVLFSAVYASAFSSPHVASGLQHRHLGHRLANRAPSPLVSPRALHRRCQPRHTLASSSAPAPTTTEEAKPTTEEKKDDPAPTTQADQPKDTPQNTDNNNNNNNGNNNNGSGGSAPNGFLAGQQHGLATFYKTGVGACGVTNEDSDFICAVSHELFDSYPGYNGNPNLNPVCNKQIIATVDGKDVTLTVTDRCEACELTDLDFSPDAFKSVADPGRGRIHFSWRWVEA